VDELVRQAASIFKVAFATLLAFFAGELKAENDAAIEDEKRKVKELKTDAKNRDDVDGLDHGQRLDELRQPPRRQ
jgi:hypothetical protein